MAVTVKDASGHVYFDSAQPAASGAIRTESTTAAALTAMTASDTYTIARLSCLLDPIAAKADVEGMGLKNTGGYIFYDGNNLNWLDPSKPAARQYLCGLAKELAEMGFDEILLDNWGYPAEGNLGYIKQGNAYDLEHLSQPVEEFLARAEAALEPYGTRLALRSTWAVLEGDESPGGQTAQLLERYAQRVWLEAPEDGMADLLSQAGLPEGEERLALLVGRAGPQTWTVPQGIWDPEA